MGFLSDMFKDPWGTSTEIPGSPEAGIQATYDGMNGTSWNPYNPDGPSVWDRAALGYNLSDQDQERQHGRMVGTAIGSYFTGGALGSMMGSSAGGAAASGALWSGAQVAGAGGDRSDIGKGMWRGGLAGGLGGSLAEMNPAGYAGVENEIGRQATNGAIGGGVTAAAVGGNVGQGALKGGIMGGIKGYSNGGTNVDYNQTDNFGRSVPQQSQAPWASENGGITFNSTVDTGGGMSMAPWAPSGGNGGAFTPDVKTKQSSPFGDYVDNALGFFKNDNGSWNGQRIDSTVNGLMGLYGGYKRKQAADGFLRGMGDRRNAYETNMRSELQRKDAAAGRRSAYDTRSVELNAKLAALDAQQMPSLMQAKNSSLAGMFDMARSGYGMARGYGAFGSPSIQPQQWQTPQPLDFTTNQSLSDMYQPQQQLDPSMVDNYLNTLRRGRVIGGE